MLPLLNALTYEVYLWFASASWEYYLCQFRISESSGQGHCYGSRLACLCPGRGWSAFDWKAIFYYYSSCTVRLKSHEIDISYIMSVVLQLGTYFWMFFIIYLKSEKATYYYYRNRARSTQILSYKYTENTQIYAARKSTKEEKQMDMKRFLNTSGCGD